MTDKMFELLRIESSHFQFSIVSKEIQKQQQIYRSMMAKRGKQQDTTPVSLLFYPPLDITHVRIMKKEQPLMNNGRTHELQLENLLFFENTEYIVNWVFYRPVLAAHVSNRSEELNNKFYFTPSSEQSNAFLFGSVKTGNHIGWLRLPMQYQLEGKQYETNISIEVLATKMDLHQDLPQMYQLLDTEMPLWRFSLVQKTEQDTSRGKHRGDFPLMWLANFANLRQEFEQGLKVINQAPHSRLQTITSKVKPSRLKGRLNSRLEAKIKLDFANGRQDKCYRLTKQRLSFDTLENRLIKMIVTQAKRKLAEFEAHLRRINKAPNNLRLSEAFLDEIHSWQQPLAKLLSQSFFADVGKFNGSNRESLVLQQKTGYRNVYRVWQDLKVYLELFADQTTMSMRSIDQIYEVWCYLELKNILIDELGFELVSSSKPRLSLSEYFEYQLKDGFIGAFEFIRQDGIKARLAHEPRITRMGTPLRSLTVKQEPDIVLEICLAPPIDISFFWLFEVKYRVKLFADPFDPDAEIVDKAHDDATNQLHRYRDAIIKEMEDDVHHGLKKKSRPVVGVYSLYPGYFEQKTEQNPYQEDLDYADIGSFAFLPSCHGDPNNGRYWLVNFMRQRIGDGTDATFSYDMRSMTEHILVHESSRMPFHGMQQSLYTDLVLITSLPERKERAVEYFKRFENNEVCWYHLPQAVLTQQFRHHIVKELKFIVLAIDSDTAGKHIDKVWTIKRVNLVKRSQISEFQAGKSSTSEAAYYLFELGRPFTLSHQITDIPIDENSQLIRLTTLTSLIAADSYDDIQLVISI